MDHSVIDNPRLKDRVVERIAELTAERGRAGGRLLSERRLAEMLKVSRSTVQRAMNVLRERGIVRSHRGSGTYAAERPAQLPRATGAVERVRVLAPEAGTAWLDGYYYAEIWRGLEAAARRRRIGVELAHWSDLGSAAAGFAAGVPAILLGLGDHALVSGVIAVTGLRPILVDHSLRDLPATCVVDGCFEGTRQGVRRLAELGHRRIACGACPGWESVNPEKMAGYRAGLADAGLEPDGALVASTGEDAGAIGAAVERLLALPEPPTAWFCFNDTQALLLIAALEARGRRVGQDAAVLGHGDTACRKGLCRTLSSVRIPLRRMGERALEEALLAEPPVEGKLVIVRDTLVLRESVGSCPAGGMGGRRRV